MIFLIQYLLLLLFSQNIRSFRKKNGVRSKINKDVKTEKEENGRISSRLKWSNK